MKIKTFQFLLSNFAGNFVYNYDNSRYTPKEASRNREGDRPEAESMDREEQSDHSRHQDHGLTLSNATTTA